MTWLYLSDISWWCFVLQWCTRREVFNIARFSGYPYNLTQISLFDILILIPQLRRRQLLSSPNQDFFRFSLGFLCLLKGFFLRCIDGGFLSTVVDRYTLLEMFGKPMRHCTSVFCITLDYMTLDICGRGGGSRSSKLGHKKRGGIALSIFYSACSSSQSSRRYWDPDFDADEFQRQKSLPHSPQHSIFLSSLAAFRPNFSFLNGCVDPVAGHLWLPVALLSLVLNLVHRHHTEHARKCGRGHYINNSITPAESPNRESQVSIIGLVLLKGISSSWVVLPPHVAGSGQVQPNRDRGYFKDGKRRGQVGINSRKRANNFPCVFCNKK